MNEILDRLCILVGEQHRERLKTELLMFADDVRTAERERWARACEDTAKVGKARFDMDDAATIAAVSALTVVVRRLRGNDCPDKAPGQVVPWETV